MCSNNQLVTPNQLSGNPQRPNTAINALPEIRVTASLPAPSRWNDHEKWRSVEDLVSDTRTVRAQC